jgi:hypothetical protein
MGGAGSPAHVAVATLRGEAGSPMQMFQTMRSESPVRDTMRATTAGMGDTRSSRHIKELLSSQGMVAKVGGLLQLLNT